MFIFTSSGFEHAHLGTNSSHIDVTYVAHAKIDARNIVRYVTYKLKNHRDVIYIFI